MAYIGQPPFQEFTSIPTKDNFTGDGSTTAFDLAGEVPLGAENALEVFVANVRQEPGTGKAFTLGQDGSGDFKRITFASAPANGAAIYVMYTGIDGRSFTALTQLPQDLDGAELILDGDGDTTITADSDDQIDIKISGADDFQFTANTFTALSGSTIATNTIAETTAASGVTIDSVLLKDGIVTATGFTIGSAAITEAELEILDGLASTTAELGVIDGDTSATSTTLADADRVVVNDNGTMVQVALTDFETYFESSLDTLSSVTTVGALNAGSITSGFGTIDTGSSNITTTGVGSFGSLDISGNIDIDGTTNLDAVDIDGAVQLDATLTVGADDQGYDVILYGDTASANLTWDTSADDLILNGAAGLIVPDGQLTLGSTAVTSTAAEINLIDGGTARGTDAVASGDGILINDAGTMKMTNVDTVSTYFSSHNVGGGNIVTTGALNSGSITSGFGTIDTGSSTITTTGAITGGSLTADDVAINGKVITMTGSSGDTFTTTVGTNGATTLTTVDTAAAAANITITADGTAELAGTTVTLNSSGGVTLDADNGTITFADAGSGLGTITSSGYSGTAAAATTVTITDNESTDENNVIVFVAGADSDGGTGLGLESDGHLTYNPSTGTLTTTNLVTSGTHTVTDSVTMTASNAVVFEGATADAYETTLTTIDATASDKTISLPNVSGTLPVLAAVSATAITATPAELNYVDGVTSAIQTQLNAITAGDWVTAARIADDVINSEHYAAGSIDNEHLADDAVDSDEIAAGAIDTAHFSADCITADEIGDNVINSEHYAAGSIDNEHLAANSVDSDNYVDGSIDTAHYAAGSVDATALGADCVTAAKIGDNVLDSEHYAAGSIDNEHLAANSVDSAQYVDDSIDTAHYAAGSVDTTALGADCVTAAKIGDDVINSEHYADLSIDAAHLAHDQRSAASTDDRYWGNSHDYIFADADVGLRFYSANAEDMRLEDDGDLHVDGDIIAFSTTISDATLKYNINPVEFALDKIQQLKGVTFNYFKDNKESAGLLAQDVEKVMPSAVSERKIPLHTDDDKSYKTLHYDSVTAILVEAIKELTAKVEKLEKK